MAPKPQILQILTNKMDGIFFWSEFAGCDTISAFN